MRRVRLDLVVLVLLAATVVAFAAGSSSVLSVVRYGRAARWVALLALFVAAAAWAQERRGRTALRPALLVAAVAFLALTIESAVWSVNPRLTLERAATFVLLFATAAALAAACAERPAAGRLVLAGLVAGAAVVTALGLVVLAFDHAAAVEQATPDLPARYRGFGENPNTVSLLLALCLPVATWLAFQARGRGGRVLAVSLAIGFDASIVASGSRGALAAGCVGTLAAVALAPARLRTRLVSAAAVLVLLGASVAIALAPKSKGEASAPPPPPASSKPAPKPKPGYLDMQAVYPLEFDVGNQVPGQAQPSHRTLLGLTGRGEAWRGALDQADERPALGYGFGTEDRVFVDRYANFAGGLPENSYIGIYLQLGAVGLACFLVLVGALALAAGRSLPRPEAALSLAVLLTALVLAVAQSYIYSVGNIGTVTVWICSFLGVAAVGRRAAA